MTIRTELTTILTQRTKKRLSKRFHNARSVTTSSSVRLLIIGGEYAGKRTLAAEMARWMIRSMGLQLVRWHDHFVMPRLDLHTIVHAKGDATLVGKETADLNTDEDERQIMSLRPSVLEQLQRHNIWRYS